MEILETAAPVETISKTLSDWNSFFKVSTVDLIKGFHCCLLSPGLFFLLYSLHCVSNDSYLQLFLNWFSLYGKDYIGYLLLSSITLLLVFFDVVSGTEGLHGQFFWSHEWNIYPVCQLLCNSILFVESPLLLGGAMAFVSSHTSNQQ